MCSTIPSTPQTASAWLMRVTSTAARPIPRRVCSKSASQPWRVASPAWRSAAITYTIEALAREGEHIDDILEDLDQAFQAV